MLLADIKEKGEAIFNDVRLQLNVGSQEAQFVLRFMAVYSQDLTPLVRDGDTNVVVAPDVWPK